MLLSWLVFIFLFESYNEIYEGKHVLICSTISEGAYCPHIYGYDTDRSLRCPETLTAVDTRYYLEYEC